jgi:hypothetical protein
MRILLLLSFFVLNSNLFGQAFDSLGIDDKIILNRQESIFLNDALIKERDTFDFTNKRIVFITGSSGSKVISKSEYFRNCVKPWTEKNSLPQIFFVRLTTEEKHKSGGYDAFVLSWVKLFTEKRKAKIIDQLKSRVKPG